VSVSVTRHGGLYSCFSPVRVEGLCGSSKFDRSRMSRMSRGPAGRLFAGPAVADCLSPTAHLALPRS